MRVQVEEEVVISFDTAIWVLRLSSSREYKRPWQRTLLCQGIAFVVDRLAAAVRIVLGYTSSNKGCRNPRQDFGWFFF